jgi:hypothetical protein
MYSTCLFCHAALGTNEVIEHFPIGRRLAFDAAKGRLWVVCKRCERWNLTPLEERWEAIEECERIFSDTRLRVSTGNIGLAKLREGLELVRIGSALRPEMAAWRYGDQFGRRRVKHLAITGGVIAAVGGLFSVGMATGVLAGGGWGIWQGLHGLHTAYQKRRSRVKLALPGEDRVVVLQKSHLEHTALLKTDDGWSLNLSIDAARRPWRGEKFESREYRGDEALRIAGQVLPKINLAGASKAKVQDAVKVLERHGDPMQLFEHEARLVRPKPGSALKKHNAAYIARFPLEARLALEMAAHEEQERRAMEGELALLEAAWRQAEEIAKIADEMFLPEAATDRLDELKARE